MKRILKLCVFLLAGFAANAQVPPYVPFTGLKAWFPFRTSAADSTMHGHDGTMHGCTNALGRFNEPSSALRFNGTSDHIYIPPGITGGDGTIDITSSLTISAWVKAPTYLTAQDMQIYWRGDATPTHDPHMLYIKAGRLYMRRDVNPGTVTNEVGTLITALDTNYHMFTGTYDSASGLLRVYVDGILKNTGISTGLQTYPTSTMYNYIGAVDGGTWQFFNGTMDELGVWNRALTPCEIATMYAAVTNPIASHPIHDTETVGGTASFSVSAAVFSPSYQWQIKVGSSFTNLADIPPYSGVTTNTLTISPLTMSMNGYEFRCLVSTDSCVNVASDTASLRVVPLVSVANNFNKEYRYSIFPNPGNGSITIEAIGVYGTVDIDVMDVAGRILFSDGWANGNGDVVHNLDVRGRINSGVYLIRLSHNNQTSYVRYIYE